jgi:hypothetical protein
MSDEKYYVCGGVYGSGEDKKFSLVKPSGREALPYVMVGEDDAYRWFKTMQHHSHLYRLLDDGETLELVKQSWEADPVGAPGLVRMGWYLTTQVKKSMVKPLPPY